MEVVTATTEATLSAIHESLAKLTVSLGHIAARQENMLENLKKTTAALSPTATTTSASMSDQAWMRLETKPLSHKVPRDARDAAATVFRVSPALSVVAPTRCSTLGLVINGGTNHAALESPSEGNTEAAILAPLEPWLDKPLQSHVDFEFNMLTPTICSVQCCHDGGDVQKFAFMSASSSGSSSTPFMPADAEFSSTPSTTAIPVAIKCNYTVTPPMIDKMADEVFTDVGGFSLFLELELDCADEVFNDSCLKDMVWDEELADYVITHIGSSSLFLEKIGDTHHELEGEIQHGHDIGTLFLQWDPGDWCSLQFGIPPWRLSCFSPGKGEHQRDLHYVNIGCSIYKEIKQRPCGLVRLWDPGISTAVPNAFDPGIFATQGNREWSYTNHNACQRSNSEKLGHLNILQQRACILAWQPYRYIQGVAVSDLVSIKTGINFYIFLNETSRSLHKKAENYIMLMGTNLHEHAYELYSNQRTKLQVQLPWNPNNAHIAQFIIWVAPGRPWDPGIVAIREWIVLGDNNAEVGVHVCLLDQPLLGGKQCFLEAVMSCPYMEENCTCWTWAVGCWYGLVAWLVSYKRESTGSQTSIDQV